MLNLNKLSWFIQKDLLSRTISSRSERSAFWEDISFHNYSRLRSLLFISFPLILLLVFIDIFYGNLWDKNTASHFYRLDITLLLFASAMFTINLIDSVRLPSELRLRHKIYIISSIFIAMLWVAAISSVEFLTIKSIPTYIIGCFFLSSFFILKSGVLLFSFAGSFTFLVGRLLFFEVNSTEFVQLILPTLIMLFLAFIISRMLFNKHLKAFHASYELKNTNIHLDELVKIRTNEICEINKKLNSEIEARLKYEEQLKKEISKASEADMLKSAFLANMSHEIRTPLNGIIGFADLLTRENLSIEKRERYTSIIKNNSNQLLQLIDDIIDISMIESNQLKFNYSNVSIDSFFTRLSDFFKNYIGNIAPANMHFESRLELNGLQSEAYIDENRVRQVIYNLIGNALKFTPDGYIKLLVRNDGNELFFMVEDSGIGISSDKRDVIFERFRQLDSTPNRQYGGTGLGLSISQGIVQHMKGKIWLDISHINGARFCFSIPNITGEQELKSYNKHNNLKNRTALKNKRIILLSENENTADFLSKTLEPAIVQVINSEKALNTDLHPVSELAIYHLNGKMFSINTARRLKEFTKQQKVIVLVDSDTDTSLITKAGYNNVLRLPLNISWFVSTLL